ncbi:hypothetical protein OH77DRAFT_1587288 [Trametes cingulata]|nr:hypothetical protein OH77DRAFT_1587288 [Trametes cingulata]
MPACSTSTARMQVPSCTRCTQPRQPTRTPAASPTLALAFPHDNEDSTKMTNIRTRARARRENAAPGSDTTAAPNATSSSLMAAGTGNANHYKAVKAARRRDTFFIEQGGHARRILADQTRLQTNLAARLARASDRRKTMGDLQRVFVIWSPEGEASGLEKPNVVSAPAAEERTPAPPRETARVRWAKRIEVFERSPDERSDVESPSAVLTPPLRDTISHHPPAGTESPPIAYPEVPNRYPRTPQVATSRLRRHAVAYIGKTPPAVTMRSRRHKLPGDEFSGTGTGTSTAAHESVGVESLLSSGNLNALKNSSGHSLISVASDIESGSTGHTPYPRSVLAATRSLEGLGHEHTAPRPSVVPCPVCTASGSTITSAYSGSDHPDPTSAAPHLPAPSPGLLVHSAPASRGNTGYYQRLSRVDRCLLWFGVVYVVFGSVMFGRMFGVW